MTTLRSLVLTTLLLLALSASDSYAKTDEATMLEQGMTQYQAGNYYYASSWFERILKQYPNTAKKREILTLLATSCAVTGREEKAGKVLRNLLREYPQAAQGLDPKLLQLAGQQPAHDSVADPEPAPAAKVPAWSKKPAPAAVPAPEPVVSAAPAPTAKIAAPAPPPAPVAGPAIPVPAPMPESRKIASKPASASAPAARKAAPIAAAKPAPVAAAAAAPVAAPVAAPAAAPAAAAAVAPPAVAARPSKTPAKPGKPATPATQAKQVAQVAKATAKPAAQITPAKLAKAMPADEIAVYTLQIGEFVMKSALADAVKKVEDAGLKPMVGKGPKKKEPRIRLYYGERANLQLAKKEVEQLRSTKVDAFFLKEAGGKYRIYAGSYIDEKAAEQERQRIAPQGVKVTLKPVLVSFPSYLVLAGSFSTRAAAEARAADFVKQGLKVEVIEFGAQEVP